jgi:tripartite ATP-independent transporter DctM subunit
MEIKMFDPIGISILLGTFALFLILRTPITFSLIISTIITAIYTSFSNNMELTSILMAVIQKMVQGLTNFSLLAIPFFILAGSIMTEGGISTRIVQFANVLVGRFRGGLAQINVLDSMFFGGVSGSAVADVSSIGAIVIPMMYEKGYDKGFSVAITVASACQGVLIPPSHNMIIYSFAAGGISVGRLFYGGFIPGVLLGVGLMIYCGILSVIKKYPKEPPVKFKEAIKIAYESIIGLFTFFIIILGITFGVFTATESAAMACVYALIVTVFVYRSMNLRKFLSLTYSSLKTLAIVMSLIGAASAFGYFLTYYKVPAIATQALLTITNNKILLTLLVNVVLLILGCIMDMSPLILITTPILYPVLVTKLGMDPVHFGVMLIFNLAIGLCTPPVGAALFVGCAVGKIRIEEATKALLPIYGVMIVVLMVVTFVPQLTMVVPNIFMPERNSTAIIVEAEDYVKEYGGPLQKSDDIPSSNKMYIKNLNNKDQAVEWNIDIPVEGAYQIVLRYQQIMKWNIYARLMIDDKILNKDLNKITLEPTAAPDASDKGVWTNLLISNKKKPVLADLSRGTHIFKLINLGGDGQVNPISLDMIAVLGRDNKFSEFNKTFQ